MDNVGRNKAELAEAESRLHSEVMKNMAEGVFLVGAEDGMIIYANPKFEKMFGYDAGEMNGQHVSIVNAPTEKDPKETAREITEVLSKTGQWHGEVNNIKKDGTSFWCYANCSIFNHPEYGRVTVAVHTDITDRKRAEEEVRLLTTAVEQSSEGVAVVDLEGNILSLNKAFAGMHGYTAEELIGRHLSIFHTPEQMSEVQKANKQIKRTGEFDGEIWHKRRDGTVFPILMHNSILSDETGTPIGMIGTARDITERKQAEVALRESEEIYRSLVENVDFGITIIDANHNIVMANATVCEWFNKSPDELVGRKCYRVFEKKDHPCSPCPGVEAMATDRPCEIETKGARDNGIRFVVKHRAFPYYGPNGEIVGFHEVLEDITERKQAEAKLTKSENRFRELFRHMSSGVAVYEATDGGRDFVFKDFNRAGERINETKREDVLGRKVTEVFPGVEEFGLLEVFRRVWKTGNPEHFPVALYKDERISGWWENYVYKLPFGEIVAVYDDITERKKAEQKLQTHRYYLEKAQEIGNIGTWQLDIKKNILTWTDENYQIFGVPAGTALTYESFLECVHPDDREYVNTKWMAGVAGEPYDVEHRIIADGKVKWVREKAELFFNDSGEVVRAIGVTQDITYRKQAENELRQVKEQAEAANMAKSQFLANMSHEIRTPMSVIMGFANLLTMEKLTDEQRTQAILIKKAGKSLLRIIDDVLDFSRIEAGKLEVRTKEFHLKKLLDKVESMMQPLAAKKGLDFELSCSKSLPAMIHTDDDRLVQCLVNLIGNAIKFTDKGNVHLKVSLEKRRNISFVRFDVKDTGMGIPPAKKESIFSSFTQVDGSHTRKQGGTGLGLTITRELAGLLGGRLSFTSEAGAGSVFSLAIPVEADAESSILPGGDQSEESVSQSQSVDNLTFRGRVLVAEDEEGSKILAERILTRLGLEVVIAANGKEAIEKALQESWDLILMDIQMPVMNGFEAVRKLRQDGITTPVVALTAHAMPGDRKKCLGAGCDDYISKPFEMKELQEVLSSHISIAGSQT